MKNPKILILITLILIITFASFYPSLKNNFINWDDDVYVTKNTAIRFLSLNNVKRIFTSFYISNYQPLTVLSYLIEYRIFKLNPFGYHLTNLILHLLNCLLVFWIIYIFTRKISISSITAVLFGIHPLHVESVAWISERKDVLYAFFFLGAIISYLLYIRKENKQRYYYVSVSLFLLSLLSKSMAITLPLVLFLIDYFVKRKPDKISLLDKIPYFILSFIFGTIAIFSQVSGGAVRNEGAAVFLNKIAIASYGIVFHINKILLPVKLSCLYPYSGIKDIAFFSYTFIILLAAVILSTRYTKKVMFGSAFFLITVIPVLVLQFIPIGETIVADRYVYIASIGIFYIIAEGFFWLYSRKIKRSWFLRCLILVTLLGTTGALVSLTWKRCQAWKNSLSLWNDVLKNYPGVATAYSKRGEYFLGNGEYDKARSDFMLAINVSAKYRYRPKYNHYYLNLGNSFRAMGKNSEAIAVFKQLIKFEPEDAEAYFNLANISDMLGDKNEAIALYRKALDIDPRHANAYYYLGVLYDNLNRKEEAKDMLIKAIEMDPAYELAYVNIAHIYKSLGKEKELISLYKKAIAGNLDFFDAYYYIGNLYSDMNKERNAISLYRRAIQINPKAVEAYVNLGSSYCAIGKNKEAITWLKKALELNPNLAVAHNNIAVAYYYENKYSLAKEHYDRAVELGYSVKPDFLESLKQ